MSEAAEEIEDRLATYRVGDKPLYAVGTFDSGVTVWNQQVRALNLVHALVETETLQCNPTKSRKKRVAIVGGGFTGITVAAGLIEKGVHTEITIFEERDTLIPLQQGSDCRWLHPHIYDWPGEGSESAAAMLPVLNWTAARASDVVVQILTEWKRVAKNHKKNLFLFCNTRHLQVLDIRENPTRLQIEWVGEERDATDGTSKGDLQQKASGQSRAFDLVILGIGFGLERDKALSYWRNETLGQPSLDQPCRTYIVSGQGDGAMIDLFRLRISQFRQDRILDELFYHKDELVDSVRDLHNNYRNADLDGTLFDELEKITRRSNSVKTEFNKVIKVLRRRLRRDTEVILRLRVRTFSEIFDPKNTRISFQNKLLIYLLYKCGAFFPTCAEEEELSKQHDVSSDKIIRRHGTQRYKRFERLLSEELYRSFEGLKSQESAKPHSQSARILWPGGYFGYSGASKDTARVGDPVRREWRKEYLPGPTELLATSFCASIAGVLQKSHLNDQRLRVTLHRALTIGDDELLQQTCDYIQTVRPKEGEDTAARTFPAENATIGLAYRYRKIIRSTKGITPKKLAAAMKFLKLNKGSRKMSKGVGFILAIPLLEPDTDHTPKSPIAGVIYIDSEQNGFFIEDGELSELVVMAQLFLDGLERSSRNTLNRVRNLAFKGDGGIAHPSGQLDEMVSDAIELVSRVEPPRTSGPFQFNFDYSDIAPVR